MRVIARRIKDGVVVSKRSRVPQKIKRDATQIAGSASATIGTQPGDLLAIVIQKVTGLNKPLSCGCAARQAQMNEWGWLGCLRHRKTIIEWLVQEAARRGHPIESKAAVTFLKAAVREINERRSPGNKIKEFRP